MNINNFLTPDAQNAFSGAGQAIKKTLQPLAKPAEEISNYVAPIKQAFEPVKQQAESVIKTVKKPLEDAIYANNVATKITDHMKSKGINAETIRSLASVDGSDPEEAFKFFRDNGIKVEGMEETPQVPKEQVQKEQPKGEGLSFGQKVGEFGKGVARTGMFLPEMAGNIGGMIPGALGEGAGIIGEQFGVNKEQNPFYTSLKQGQKATEGIGQDITGSAVKSLNLTPEQEALQRMGAQTAVTLPVGGEYLAGAKGLGSLAFRSGVVGAGMGATNPVLEKGSEATMGDIGKGALSGAVTGAIAGPVLGKVVAPAIGGVINKGMKYGNAAMEGGIKGLGKSIASDIPKGVPGTKNMADRVSTNALARMKKSEITKFTEQTGESPGEFLNNRGIVKSGDDLIDTLASKAKESKAQADKAIEMIKGDFKMPVQKTAMGGKDYVSEMLKDNLKKTQAQGLAEESIQAQKILDKYQSKGLTLKEINEAQRFFQRNNTFDYMAKSLKPDMVKKVTNIDSKVRDWKMKVGEVNGLDNLREINKTTQAYNSLLRGVGDWQEGIQGNNVIGLGDYLSFIADPKLFLAKQISGAGVTKRAIVGGLNKLSGREIKSDIVLPNKSNIIKEQVKKQYDLGSISGDHPSYKMGEQRPVKNLALPPASGKPTSADVVNVKPMEGTPKESGMTGKKGIRPGTK